MRKEYRVIIPPTARESLRDIVRHIKKDSPSSAIRVKKKLIEIAKSLEFLPERFSKELYLAEKDGNYRSVTQWHFKIIYKVWMRRYLSCALCIPVKTPMRLEK